MSTMTAHSTKTPSLSLFSRYHFLLRRLHSLTGIIFGLYLFVHLGVNATIIEGARHAGSASVFQEQVNQIHRIPFLLFVEIAMIFLPLLYHTVYGTYITFTGQWNVGNYGYTRNYLYVLQRITAMIILFFALFHILTMRGFFPGEIGTALAFEPQAAVESTARHLVYAWWIWAVVYPIGILASALHTANGFYAAAITWGLTISEKAQKRWGAVAVLMFLFLFGAGMTALVAGVMKAQPGATETVHTVVH
jgi:succinate dehydrogenase / fumarate reductase, cytochrome b subunit